ncbi:prolyl-tRNA synthetase associated domain-containing protein [Paenibacillus sp. MABNS29]|uniref:prolyl-tRNA synthetase associated domain-containing protein n=1 Tax=Paenibacillus sp. MABNS29 TaxID=3142627 RepID=UPI003D276519
MFFISNILISTPEKYLTQLQERTYETLEKLQIPFERVNTDEAISMEDCIEINQKLNVNMVKTLFLCNRQQTQFYLLITTADKQFKAKDFSNQLGISRVSFASADQLEHLLGVKIGAVTIFGVLLDKDQVIQVVLDEEVVAREWYGCSDGTTTGYMKIRTSDVTHRFLPYTDHLPKVIQI